jgi:hypothetical protein
MNWERERLADDVREDLLAAGLPVAASNSEFAPGAYVYVDNLTDEDGGGVWVDWNEHFVPRWAGMHAVNEGREDDPVFTFAGAVADIMEEALFQILTAAGYTVEKDANDMAPYHLRVTGRAERPGWRAWIDANSPQPPGSRELVDPPLGDGVQDGS